MSSSTVCWTTYIVLLSFEFLAKIELLGLQPHQPLPQLVGLLPEHITSRNGSFKCNLPDVIGTDVKPCTAMSYFSLSSFRWSTLRGFLRSARIFFFFSLSVCFLAPLLFSLCVGQVETWLNQSGTRWIHPLLQQTDKHDWKKSGLLEL